MRHDGANLLRILGMTSLINVNVRLIRGAFNSPIRYLKNHPIKAQPGIRQNFDPFQAISCTVYYLVNGTLCAPATFRIPSSREDSGSFPVTAPL